MNVQDNPNLVTVLNCAEFNALRDKIQKDTLYAWEYNNVLGSLITEYCRGVDSTDAARAVGEIMNDLFGVNPSTPSFADKVNTEILRKKNATPTA